MQVLLSISENDWNQVKILISEYVEWVTHDQGVDLNFWGIEDELKSLPRPYSPPDGCMLIAEIDGQAAGCVALRRFNEEACEMKRMYVNPEFRTKGIGRALAEQIIREAKKMGYRRMRLCTANTWVAAQKLYQSLGFTPTNQYYDFPPNLLPSAVFMELSLE